MQVNKTQVKEKITELKELSVQDEDGQFIIGSVEQQEAARKVEMLLLCTGAARDVELTAAALLALVDIQVRDYAMGLVNSDNFNHYQRTFKWLTKMAPVDYTKAPTSILALTYYESGNNELALTTLKPALNKGYSLAILLKRVVETGWPLGAFAGMRIELHPKVTAGIFGEETNDNSNKK